MLPWTRLVLVMAALACSRAAAPPATPSTPPAEAEPATDVPAEDEAVGMTKVDRPNPLPQPLTAEQVGVGTQRTLVVLAASSGRDADEDAFQIAVSQLENLRMPVQVFWLGCQPKAVQAVGQSGERWVATLSFASRDEADAYVLGKGLSPLAIVDDEVEPCGD